MKIEHNHAKPSTAKYCPEGCRVELGRVGCWALCRTSSAKEDGAVLQPSWGQVTGCGSVEAGRMVNGDACDNLTDMREQKGKRLMGRWCQ